MRRDEPMSLTDDRLQDLIAAAQRDEQLHAGRRRFFVCALASGVAVATGNALAQSPAPPSAGGGKLTIGEGGRGPSRIHPSFVKDVGLMTDLNKTNQGAAWWNFDTYITPVSEFYIRNAFPTPR